MDPFIGQFRLMGDSASEFDPDFGNAATDYERYRAEYPAELFERLDAFGVGSAGQRVLDLGTGTGFLARGLSDRGSEILGIDRDSDLLAVGRRVSHDEGSDVAFVAARAEQVPLRADSVDVVTAGQCWHWFERDEVCPEVLRVIRAGGRVIITHFDWLPQDGTVVSETEALILKWNPEWPGAGGNGVYPKWARELAAAGFEKIETFSFETDVEYSHAAWRGRIRASAGVGGSLGDEELRRFDAELADLLATSFPDEPLTIPHRSFTVVGTAP